jgi:hypothetical protein
MEKKIEKRVSNKTSITKSEYFQLIGLREMARRYWQIINDLDRAGQEITGEVDEYGKPALFDHTSDYLAGSRDIDELLKILKLKVLKK